MTSKIIGDSKVTAKASSSLQGPPSPLHTCSHLGIETYCWEYHSKVYVKKTSRYLIFFFFLAALRGLWDISSLKLGPLQWKHRVFIFVFLKYLFIYLFMAALGLCCCVHVFSRCNYSLLWCAGFLSQWLLLLQSTGSRRVDFSNCGTQALEHRLSHCDTWA